MGKKMFLGFIVSLFFAIRLASTVYADGIIIPDPPVCNGRPCWDPGSPIPMEQLSIRHHNVTVLIQNQVAVTRVDQVFHNPNPYEVQGVYIFPLPAEATVSAFSLWIDGEPVKGEILEAEEARRTYEEIVRRMSDPALLEYADRGAMRASVFPIPPGGERRIELEYSQVLTAEEGLVKYIYPLNTEKFSKAPLEEVTVNLEISERSPVRAAYSPSHPVAIERLADNHLRVGYEDMDVRPEKDFALYYSVGEGQAFHLLSYRDSHDPQDADGFFLVLLAPRLDVQPLAIAKDVLFVLDRSGSMEGEKFRQSQEAARYVLRHLNPDDRFNLISFSSGMEFFAQGMRPAEDAPQALAWVDGLHAAGGTDINRALLEAISMADRERPTYLIFLTDGLPTEGEVVSQKILANLAQATSSNIRLFAFGVGYDVDTYLLDSLAQAHRGAATYVLPGEPLGEILSAFYNRIGTPLLTDLSLDFGDLPVYDLYPQPLPDLFQGSQIVAVGRYREGGATTVTLSGWVGDEKHSFVYTDQFLRLDSSASNFGPESAIPRIWATRKIGHLLNQVRLKGANQETINQIVSLSIRFGIVTPYTSYLVTEPIPFGASERERIADEQFQKLQMMPTAPVYGQQAVEQAAGEGLLSRAEVPAEQLVESRESIRITGASTFVYREGIWIDTRFDSGEMQPLRVAFLSPDYFRLAESWPELAVAFALGREVIALAGGQAYQVVAEGSAGDQIPSAALQATAVPGAVQTTQEPGEVEALPANPDRKLILFGAGLSLTFVLSLLAWRRRRHA
jgi:Ca-activated chloride channel homolog